jgi:hypothetical protein
MTSGQGRCIGIFQHEDRIVDFWRERRTIADCRQQQKPLAGNVLGRCDGHGELCG